MKVSIVMAYFNRLDQLGVTLRTINKTSYNDVEIIVVDDASSTVQHANKIVSVSRFKPKVISVRRREKRWNNPCIPFNMGIKAATGDIIMLQNPENLHCGDIISHMIQNITPDSYLVYACYSVDNCLTARIRKVDFNSNDYDKRILSIVSPMRTDNSQGPTRWANHPVYWPTNYHYVSAAYADKVRIAGGFDERYSKAPGYDDDDFVLRMKHDAHLRVVSFDENAPLTIHQHHSRMFRMSPVRNKAMYDKIVKDRNNRTV